MGRLKSGLPTDLMDMPVEKDKTSEDGHPSITSLDRERKHTRFIEIEKVTVYFRPLNSITSLK